MAITLSNPEAERAVLGAVLVQPEIASPIVFGVMRESFFHKKASRTVFTVMKDLWEERGFSAIDIVVIKNELRNRGILDDVGGAEYLAGLLESVASAANAEHYAKIVVEFAMRRNLRRMADNLAADADNTEKCIEEIISDHEEEIYDHKQITGSDDAHRVGVLAKEELERIERGDFGDRIYTGFSAIDGCVGGFADGQLILVAGRPGMGKSSFACQMAMNVADQGFVAQFFSLEMRRHEVALRSACCRTGVDFSMAKDGKFHGGDLARLTEAVGEISEMDFWVEDVSGAKCVEGVTVNYIRSQVRKMQGRKKKKVVPIVDYLHLINPGKGENQNVKIGNISRSLKALAMELQTPVVALSQLRREVENRMPPIPMLSDLRDSGSLEQDADIILFLYRPDYYNSMDEPGNVHVVIAKQRSGPTRTVFLRFDAPSFSFGDRG